ncbi:MAG: mannose-1-phosphate guanylyltransferase [Deltaproteobacteria bacterium]|nr:mannose-1-phosphate guanylyltransferase [Deltaproteobacteria bacterium]
MRRHIYCVLMAGGSGTRFWPLSRRKKPKQLQNIASNKSMLRLTVERVLPLSSFDRLLVVTGADQAAEVRKQIPEIPSANLIAEPVPRNTAPCVGLAAIHALKKDPDAVMVVLPADHHIKPVSKFRTAISTAARRAIKGGLVTVGIRPTRPETGYGYLELKEKPGSGQKPVMVKRFVEKPDSATAKKYIRGGRHLWNAGIFVFTARKIMDELETHMPRLHTGLMEIADSIGTRLYNSTLEHVFPRLEAQSIDYGVMEKVDQNEIFTVPACFHWSDVGSFAALPEVARKDKAGNVVQGDALLLDTNESVVLARGGRLVAVLGLDDVVVVDAGDSVLVCPVSKAQKVKEAVGVLRKKGRTELL